MAPQQTERKMAVQFLVNAIADRDTCLPEPVYAIAIVSPVIEETSIL
ncbi:hypothetical protein [Alteromonas sp. H39]